MIYEQTPLSKPSEYRHNKLYSFIYVSADETNFEKTAFACMYCNWNWQMQIDQL